jgi:hypothetical protein
MKLETKDIDMGTVISLINYKGTGQNHDNF